MLEFAFFTVHVILPKLNDLTFTLLTDLTPSNHESCFILIEVLRIISVVVATPLFHFDEYFSYVFNNLCIPELKYEYFTPAF